LARAAAKLARTELARAEKAARRKAIKERSEAGRIAQREHAVTLKAEAGIKRTVEGAASMTAYAHYLKVRDWLRPISASNGMGLTAVEQQMVARLGHLWDATPETIAALRQWCEPITGDRPADYAEGSSESFIRLKRDVPFLRRQDANDLFVQESPLLADWVQARARPLQRRHDSVFKALTALNDAAVLDEFRGNTPRRLVWEIGGGWGGFAFQFKTICRNVTYLITGLPETLLVSAVYLMTAFPDARFRFHSASTESDVWSDWESVDFILAPESAVPDLKPPRVDLVIDLMALRNMSDHRVVWHVQRAFDFGARYFYSIEPGPIFPATPSSAWRAIETLYWPHPIPPRLDASVFVSGASMPQVDDYAHLVGWRRIRPMTAASSSSLAATE
jgi:hypothetical protein